ncbi:MAG: tRNA lysidine(34) synthetase TilS, partial [Gammaproteobacteria bacterium]|nr:tRNA lysidine(34) synthetase TilS [Gammaproteobacteria bacterium]
MSRPDRSLAARFRAALAEDGVVAGGGRVLVSLSGGLDSTVLLHLLRFTPGLPPLEVHAAHLDHRMRPGSAEDAHWVKGLARAWGVPLVSRAVARPPANETEARRARYRFLEEARTGTGCQWVVTAHHADDQAETVAYRMLRGTGLAGLAGIPRTREPGLYRPLLPFWKRELAAYASASRLRHRTDPTNRSADIPRNVVRRELLPLAEERVAPGARRALHRLARLAEEEIRLWHAVVPTLLAGLGVRRTEEGVSFSRDGYLQCDPLVRARLIRELAAESGASLDARGTALASEFACSGGSGQSIDLPGGAVLSLAYERLVIARAASRIAGGHPP